MVIAIDGPAGSGKSTIAKRVAEKLGIVFLNSGSFYRGITLIAQRRGIKPSAQTTLITLVLSLSMEYDNSRLVINGEDIEDLLHTDAVDAEVSQVSAIAPLRHIVNGHIRRITGRDSNFVRHDTSKYSPVSSVSDSPPQNKKTISIVCEGRDMTTVVFPDADYKFYLDASIDVQAQRRFDQGVSGLSLEALKKSIRTRDELDKQKPEGALQVAPDAHYIDTSHLTIDKVCAIIMSKIIL
jgi:cytidylate kinase